MSRSTPRAKTNSERTLAAEGKPAQDGARGRHQTHRMRLLIRLSIFRLAHRLHCECVSVPAAFHGDFLCRIFVQLSFMCFERVDFPVRDQRALGSLLDAVPQHSAADFSFIMRLGAPTPRAFSYWPTPAGRMHREATAPSTAPRCERHSAQRLLRNTFLRAASRFLD